MLQHSLGDAHGASAVVGPHRPGRWDAVDDDVTDVVLVVVLFETDVVVTVVAFVADFVVVVVVAFVADIVVVVIHGPAWHPAPQWLFPFPHSPLAEQQSDGDAQGLSAPGPHSFWERTPRTCSAILMSSGECRPPESVGALNP